ncbi:12911_t:CDS:2 [Funneliformis geosporum]|uniref:9197_t:CDS:1 n=1 Tax=Funneliformis geosporum TaxID=1117311 RepID=A0A9W4SVT9_9GLOM|nr:12911_t:CDS:2 [Funneliformis geosporum]CAI2183214.1 9197_t:CDS:2 [Funneliformis geosporum]
MQSPSISKVTPKQDFENQFETYMKQQKVDKNNNSTPSTSTTPQENPSVTTGLMYKFSAIAAYTTTIFSETYKTLTAAGTIEPESPTVKRRDYNNDYFNEDVMQINADDSDGAYDNDEMSDVDVEYNGREINKKIDKKMEAKWSVNDDDEPPPPYDSICPSSTSTYNADTCSGATNLTESPTSSSPKQINCAIPLAKSKSTPTPSPKDVNSQTFPKRRQIRVRRFRRLIRRKSTNEVLTPRGGSCDDPDELLLKVNDKLSDMIAQGRAALTSQVDISEVDMLLAEEREREERIMKELGLQTPVGRKGRKNAAYSLEYDYFNSMSDGNYSAPESSFYEYGYDSHSRNGSGDFTSPSEFEPSAGFPSNGNYNAPPQFSSPGMYHTQGVYNFPSNLGFGLGNNSNGGKFAESPSNDFMGPIPNRYPASSSSNGFNDHSIPNGFGTGPVSGGFGGSVRFGGQQAFVPNVGPYVQNNNNGGFVNYGPGFGSNTGFGSNGAYGTNGIYHKNREFIY